ACIIQKIREGGNFFRICTESVGRTPIFKKRRVTVSAFRFSELKKVLFLQSADSAVNQATDSKG
ncbi:MAG TPA: hypothetical protein PL048_05825, partial [Leptospiraceae bacterium]|nr:hypothetical protein [Leptospiraceae bacterium]